MSGGSFNYPHAVYGLDDVRGKRDDIERARVELIKLGAEDVANELGAALAAVDAADTAVAAAAAPVMGRIQRAHDVLFRLDRWYSHDDSEADFRAALEQYRSSPATKHARSCSFCGKLQREVGGLIAGSVSPDIAICNECVVTALHVIRASGEKWARREGVIAMSETSARELFDANGYIRGLERAEHILREHRAADWVCELVALEATTARPRGGR